MQQKLGEGEKVNNGPSRANVTLIGHKCLRSDQVQARPTEIPQRYKMHVIIVGNNVMTDDVHLPIQSIVFSIEEK